MTGFYHISNLPGHGWGFTQSVVNFEYQNFIYLFNLLIYFTYLDIFIRNIFIKNLSGYISETVLYIMVYKYDSFEFKLNSL